METRILERIKKLYDKAESARSIGNEHEAEAFAAKVQELMMKHKVDMSEVEFHALRNTDPVEAEWVDSSADGGKQRARKWRWNLVGFIADAHFCKILVSRNTSKVLLIGRRSDREVAKYMINVLARTAEELADKYHDRYKQECRREYVEPKRNWRENFLHGFSFSIGRRYQEEKAAEEARMSSTGMSLVRLRSEEAEVAKVRDLLAHGKMSHRSRNKDWDGADVGALAAQKVSLRKGINEGDSVPSLRGAQ